MNLICIVIPAISDESPIKGAAALANELAVNTDVIVVSLKKGKNFFNKHFNQKCNHLDLSSFFWIKKYLFFRKYLFDKRRK